VHTLNEDGTPGDSAVFSELCWGCGENNTETNLEIYVPGEEERGRGDLLRRAKRLAAELQFLGMTTRVFTVSP
jgi:hypothetical protein